MDPLLLKPKLKLAILLCLLLINITVGKDDPLPTEGTRAAFPFVSSWNGSDRLLYSGDSFTFDRNHDLGALLDIGAPADVNDRRVLRIPPLDGLSIRATLPRKWYSMKFVSYDLRLGKLKAVDAMGSSFTIQLQIFLQWHEWLTTATESAPDVEKCVSFCDSSRSAIGVDVPCCDKIWMPPLRFPDADISRMDSIVTRGRGLIFSLDDDLDKCAMPKAQLPFGNATCFRRRFWELSLDATREAPMKFQRFPFDFQQFAIDVRNPYASRTWLQLGPGSLEARANNLIPKMSEDASSVGWKVIDLIVSPLCDVSSWKQTFFEIDAQLVRASVTGPGRYESQAEQIEQYLKNLPCPKLKSWPRDLIRSQLNPHNMTAYASMKPDYLERVDDTKTAYKQCVRLKGSVYTPSTPDTFPTDLGWIDFNDSELNLVSLSCLIDAVANLTTPGIRVSILVKRYQMYYLVKLIIPIIVCVAFAFTAFAVEVKEVGTRLAVAVPSAISLTALQVLVVATDIPVVSYIVPTTWLMLCSYLVIVLICIESMVVNKLWKLQKMSKDVVKKKFEDDAMRSSEGNATSLPTSTTTWSSRLPDSRSIDYGLMWMLLVLYTTVFLLCVLLSAIHHPPNVPSGISIWNDA